MLSHLRYQLMRVAGLMLFLVVFAAASETASAAEVRFTPPTTPATPPGVPIPYPNLELELPEASLGGIGRAELRTPGIVSIAPDVD
jgi:hypothetical protein